MTVKAAPGVSLTDRELEVARLVAGGLRSREAAERLFVSVRTIDAHLRSIYVKTGTGTRTRLALWLVNRGELAGLFTP